MQGYGNTKRILHLDGIDLGVRHFKLRGQPSPVLPQVIIYDVKCYTQVLLFLCDLAACGSSSHQGTRQVLAFQVGQQFGVLRIHLQLEQQGGEVEVAQPALQLPLIHAAWAQELQLGHFTTGKAKLQVQWHQRWVHGCKWVGAAGPEPHSPLKFTTWVCHHWLLPL